MLTSPRRLAAYTLIEVLVTVSILSILAVVVVPSLLTAGEMGVQAAARSVVADLLVAQNEAVAAQAQRTVHFDVENDRYGVFDENNAIVRKDYLPVIDTSLDYANNDVTGDAARGRNFITDFRTNRNFRDVELLDADFGGSQNVTFDALGSPLEGGWVDLQFDRRVLRVSVADFTGRLTVDERQTVTNQ